MKRLIVMDKEKMTELEKDLSDFYFDGLIKQDLRNSWYLLNYNLFFSLKFVIVTIFIISLGSFD
jgi:hypothetical protein